MDYQKILDQIKNDLDKFKKNFREQLLEIRAGKLSPSLIEDVKVNCFGSMTPLKSLGAISTPSQKEIMIQLWDKSYVEGVVKAIEKKGMGLSIKAEEDKIYLTSPPLTEESKKNLSRVLNKKKEEIFQKIRHLRDNVWKEIQEREQSGEITEDDKYKAKDKLEEIVREGRKEIEEMAENKRREIEK